MTWTENRLRHAAGQRAQTLLGDAPTMTFHVDANADACLSVQLVRTGAVWVGLVPDHALLVDRVRMGMKPRFLLNQGAGVPTVCGQASVRVLGRASSSTEASVVALLSARPFAGGDLVVLEVTPEALQLDDSDDVAHGAIPRT